MTTLLDADEARRLLAELTPAAEHTVLARALRTVVAVQVALDHAVAKAQQLARILANEVTAQDAVELLSAVLVRDAASAPNCMEWRGTYDERAFSLSFQWADGKSPHALIDEARRERDALRAILDGRETPPTDAEIDAHAAAGGMWFVFATRSWGDTSWRALGHPRAVREYIQESNAPDPHDPDGDWRWSHRWIAIDHKGKPCPWPVTP